MPESKSIFIAEDDHFLSSLLKSRLQKDGFEVTQAFDGQEALKVLREIPIKPNLIVMDLIMPKISGFEVLEQVVVDPQLNKIPVFILTNLAQDLDVQKAARLGAKEYFVKVRVSVDQIITRIKSLLLQP